MLSILLLRLSPWPTQRFSFRLRSFIYSCGSDYRISFEFSHLVVHGAFASALLPRRASKSIRENLYWAKQLDPVCVTSSCQSSNTMRFALGMSDLQELESCHHFCYSGFRRGLLTASGFTSAPSFIRADQTIASPFGVFSLSRSRCFRLRPVSPSAFQVNQRRFKVR